MEPSRRYRRTLIYNIIHFLSREQRSTDLTIQDKKWLDVVSGCLENVYKLTKEEKQKMELYDLLQVMRGEGLDSASQKRKRLAEYHRKEGNSMMNKMKYRDALAEYTRALHNDSENPIILVSRANAYIYLQENERAIDDCKTALVLNPKYAPAYGRMGTAFLQQKKYNQAISAFQKVKQVDPSNTFFDVCLEYALENVFQGVESAIPDEYLPRAVKSFLNSSKPYLTLAKELKFFPEEMKFSLEFNPKTYYPPMYDFDNDSDFEVEAVVQDSACSSFEYLKSESEFDHIKCD